LDVPIRELLPPASTIAVAHARYLADRRIVRRRSLLEPDLNSPSMGEAPFLEHSLAMAKWGRPIPAPCRSEVVEQPFFECFRPRIVFNCLSQSSLDRKPEGIGSLIPLAFSSLSFRGFERGEQGPAYVGWAKLGRMNRCGVMSSR